MTAWFTRKPGDVVSPSTEDPTMAIVGGGLPDWIRLPPELGGGTVRPVRQFGAPCPKCDEGPPVRHIECNGGLHVAECERHGFVWYRRRAAATEAS
jgi:hypothetical protein